MSAAIPSEDPSGAIGVSAEGQASIPGPPSKPSIYFTTFVGLLVGFIALWLHFLLLFRGLTISLGISETGAWFLLQAIVMFAAALTIIGIVTLIDREPLTSIGLRRPTVRDFGWGALLFVLLLATSVLMHYVLNRFWPHAMTHLADQQRKEVTSLPFWIGVAMAVGAGISEEIASRGFAITRLTAITHRLILGAALALILDLADHLPYWGLRYAIAIAPVQIVLTIAYLWRRDIMANIFAHSLMDAFPFVLPLVWSTGIGLFGMGSMHAVAASDYNRQGEYEEAVVEYTQALEKHPGNLKLLMARANVEIKSYDSAPAIEDLDEVLRIDPKYAEALTARATLYSRSNNYDRALADAGRVIALSPEDPDAYRKRAEIARSAKLYDAEIADLTEAIKLQKRPDALLFEARGWAYLKKHDCDPAVGDLNRAAQIDPADNSILVELGEALECRSDFEQAEAKWTEVLKRDPEDDHALLARGKMYAKRGQYSLAKADLGAAANGDDEESHAENALAWLLSTCPDKATRDGRRALDLAGRAASYSAWKDPEILDTLAAAYAELGNFPEAIAWEQRAIDFGKSLAAEALSQFRERLMLYQKGQPYREAPKFAKAS